MGKSEGRTGSDLEGPNYLLDANCFYAASKNRRVLDSLGAIRPKVSVSPVTVLEIARISPAPGDFYKRKLAMRALEEIDPYMLPDNPDSIVAKAFNGRAEQIEPRDVLQTIRTICLAYSYEEAVTGVRRRGHFLVYRLRPDVLDKWKSSVSGRFVDAIITGRRDVYEMLMSVLRDRHPAVDERELSRAARDVAVKTTQTDKACDFTIAGLSVRSRVRTEWQLTDALRTGTSESFIDQVKALYDGSLDDFVKVLLELQRRVQQGYNPEKNLVFDLELFIHISAGKPPMTLVTTEKLLMDLGASALPGKVVGLHEAMRSLEEEKGSAPR